MKVTRTDMALLGRFFIIFFFLSMFLTIPVASFYKTETKHTLEIQKFREDQKIPHLIQSITNKFPRYTADLMILSLSDELRSFLNIGDTDSRTVLERLFKSFSEQRGYYDRIGFMDQSGVEVVRVDHVEGKITTNRKEKLQDKEMRHYFPDTFRLDKNEIYVSPMDLNIVRGEIETTFKPMMWLGMPVFDDQGVKRGVLVFNIPGRIVFDHLESEAAAYNSRILLINKDGDWLRGPYSKNDGGSVLEEGTKQTFADAYPDEWDEIRRAERGQFRTSAGLFTYATITPLSTGMVSSAGSREAFGPSRRMVSHNEYHWKVISQITPDALSSATGSLKKNLLFLWLVLVILLTLISWWMTEAMVARKRYVRDLTETMTLYKTLVESSQQMVYIVDFEGCVTFANQKTCLTFGRDLREIIGQEIGQFFPTELVELFNRDIPMVLSTGKISVLQSEVTFPDGKKWHDTQLIPLKNQIGEYHAVMVVSRDITERKWAEEQLLRSKRFLNSILDSIQDGILVLDREFRIVRVNPAMAKLYPHKQSPVGMKCHEAYHGQSHRCVRCPGQTTVDTGKVCRQTIPFEGDGKKAFGYLDLHSFPMFSGDTGEVEGIIVIARDITNSKRAERNLSETTARLLRAQKMAQLGIWEWNIASGEVSVSEEFCKYLGVEPGTIRAMEDITTRYIAKEDIMKVTKKTLKALKGDGDVSLEYSVVLPNNRIRILNSEADVTFDEDGNAVRMFGVVKDITEHRLIEEQLRTSLEEKKVLLQEVHHRVKNNLLAINGLISLQAAHFSDKHSREVLKDSQNRILSMAIVHEKLYQIKNVSRIAFGDYIRTLTDHLLHSYGIDPKAVRTEVSCDGSELNVDTAIPCGLIVNELVSNSLKHAFNKKNGGIVRIDMHQLLDSEFQLTISDNGIGLPLDYNLLDKNTLGLNLVRNLVEQLGGDLEVSGRGGTSFSIKFKEYRECGIELH